MKYLILQSALHKTIVLWSIAGYPLLAAFGGLLQMDSSGVSIMLRGLVTVFSLLLILMNLPSRLNVPLLLFIMFWVAYLLRLTISLELEDEVLSRSSFDYWIWSIGACMMPALAILLSKRIIKDEKLFMQIAIISCVSSVMVYLAGILYLNNMASSMNRMAMDTLNPISIGHLGVSTAICGLIGLITDRGGKIKMLFFGVSFFIGMALAIMANSRGPIVSFLIAIILYLYAQRRNTRNIIQIIGAFLMVVIIVYVMRNEIFSDIGLQSRFIVFATEDDMSSLLRIIAYNGAWEQFLGSPFFGDGVEERLTQFYPHNLVLEVLMATGIAGGIPYLGLLLIGTLSAFRLIGRSMGESLFGLLSIQQTIAGQFSGAIYNSTGFWVLLCYVIALDWVITPDKHRFTYSYGGMQ